jgi:hypothetical protein
MNSEVIQVPNPPVGLRQPDRFAVTTWAAASEGVRVELET